MNFEINGISIPNVITADVAKELVRQNRKAEIEKDIKKVLDCIREEPWDDIRARACEGITSYSLTIGCNKVNTCHIRWSYGWTWLHDEGAQLIKHLFTSLGYQTEFIWYDKFVRIDISWAK